MGDSSKYYLVEINYEGGEHAEIYFRINEFGNSNPKGIVASLKHLECGVRKISLEDYLDGVEKIARGK